MKNSMEILLDTNSSTSTNSIHAYTYEITATLLPRASYPTYNVETKRNFFPEWKSGRGIDRKS